MPGRAVVPAYAIGVIEVAPDGVTHCFGFIGREHAGQLDDAGFSKSSEQRLVQRGPRLQLDSQSSATPRAEVTSARSRSRRPTVPSEAPRELLAWLPRHAVRRPIITERAHGSIPSRRALLTKRRYSRP